MRSNGYTIGRRTRLGQGLKDLARVAVNFLMSIKNKEVQTSTRKKGNVFLTTYSFKKKGIQKFKQAGFESAMDEMRQLHDRECWDVVDPGTLKESETEKALLAKPTNLLMNMRNGLPFKQSWERCSSRRNSKSCL